MIRRMVELQGFHILPDGILVPPTKDAPEMTAKNINATYACINYGEAFAPSEIKNRSICIDGDIGKVVAEMV